MFSFLRKNSAKPETDTGGGASSRSARSSNQDAQDRLGSVGPACFAGPFERGVTRGDFIWALSLQNPGLGLGTTRDAAVSAATRRGILTGGRLDDAPTRAEAAALLQRSLGLDNELPQGETAYFADVFSSHWYFTAAHVARRYGLFVGDVAENRFRGDDTLSVTEAEILLGRSVSASVRSPGEQTGGATPLLEPATGLELLQQDELDHDEIAKVRAAILALPEEMRAALYEKLNTKVAYRSQRDNAGTYAQTDADWAGAVEGDAMCNMTSIAMALNQLGIGVDEQDAQFEDLLDELLVETGEGSRYDQRGQSWVAGQYGVDIERRYFGGSASVDAAQTWFEEQVAPELKKGASASLGMRWGSGGKHAHIVRLQWVEADGIRVDDPYGTLYDAGSYHTYDTNEAGTSEGLGARGEDGLWSWQTVHEVMSSHGDRYVQLYRKRSEQPTS